jgi:phosphoglycerate-specific signal transduction histidine kinase
VASLPNRRGAEETLNQYMSKGYTNVSLVEKDDRIRISLMQFTDKDEANEYLKTLRLNENFQNAWLLAVRD